MTTWEWVAVDVVYAIHDRQLSEHGGLEGIRDAGLLESALARPQNLAAYQQADAADLAAAYSYGLARNHPFLDGNKRTAWIVARLFLALNAQRLVFDALEAIRIMQSVAAGTTEEDPLADWFRTRIQA